ncbi:LysR family transcriptional regulator [Clostridium folliculivorans]|uniref:LysR family transcriptional regulator n=1 Tax=Clostridium folliculivorans TaxID=2886038 RepID=A0A9W6DCG2_9CLOT|nr:LysR family transcriptional regulator [Clostridium folliculivorans]GKU26971.1 LysR family transcriptional regulator [Clostridium folliculivorans]GKU29187.1 LysR family transcriptional regulator [Clostridium folliculivorans]
MSKYYSQDILYYIDAILKYSNYGKAAKSLYISQPYLTQVIKRVESQLDCELINRSNLPYRLTEQGKIYYQYLTSIENNYAKLLREISAVSDIDSKVIKIGVLPSLGTFLLPLFLPKFLDMHPNCKIELSETLPEKNEKLTQNGELDFWIGQNSSNISPNLNSITWGRHRYRAIIPRCCDLYQKDVAIIPEGTIDINKILCQKLILTSKGSAIRKQIDQLLSLYKVEPKIIMESTEIYTVRNLATSNLGLTFIPESVYVEECPSEYNIYEVPIDELSIDYFIAYHSEKKLTAVDTDLIEAFLTHGQNNFNIGDQNE